MFVSSVRTTTYADDRLILRGVHVTPSGRCGGLHRAPSHRWKGCVGRAAPPVVAPCARHSWASCGATSRGRDDLVLMPSRQWPALSGAMARLRHNFLALETVRLARLSQWESRARLLSYVPMSGWPGTSSLSRIARLR